jgi:hypothetical protein
MNCNIDSRGRRLRAVTGMFSLAVGLVLVMAGIVWPELAWKFVGIGIFAILCGAFQIFESRKGWCALRAMGIKTRL